MTNSPPWVHISEHARQAKEYINNRRTGQVKSILTPWTKLNNELLNGLEWKSVVELLGNSGSGKTAIKDQCTIGAVDLNLDQDFAILDLQFEMTGITRVIRDVSRKFGKDMKYIQSAFNPLSDTEYEEYAAFLNRDLSQLDLYTVEVPRNVKQIELIVDAFAASIKKPFIVTLDHSMLVPRDTEKDDWEVIRRLAEMLIRTKKKHMIIWIILNQFNREFERADRQIPNSIKAFPVKSDAFGGKINVNCHLN